MLDLYFIRHAESEANNNPNLISGRSNETLLSQNGEIQARLLAERLFREKIKFDLVFASPAIRTISTARPSCEGQGYPLNEIVVADELQELDMGQWVGQDRNKIYTPEVLNRIIADPWNFAPPSGESQRQVEERGLNWIGDTLAPLSEKNLRLGIYTHAMFIKCLLRGIMNFDPKHTYYVNIDNTSITRLGYSKDHYNFITLNDTAHLNDK